MEGNISRAKKSFMQAEQAGCQCADLYLRLGVIEANQGNEALALYYLEKALSFNDPDTKSDIHLQLGVISMMNSKSASDESKTHFEEVLKSVHANNLLARLHLGKLNQLRGEMVSENKDHYFAQAAECYKALLAQTQYDVPLHVRLLLSMQVRRLLRKYQAQGLEQRSIPTEPLIAELKAKESKSAEEMCVLFLAQVEMSNFDEAWTSFFQLLDILSNHSEDAYAAIPYYLKRDFFAAVVVWRQDKVQELQYTSKTDQWKQVVLDLLTVRDTENYDIQLMQVNAGLLALISQSLLGAILYIKQGMFISPSLSRGKLAELREHLIGVLEKMSPNVNAPGKAFQLCKTTKNVLMERKELLELYPQLYKVIVGSQPPVRQTWSSFFNSAAAAASSVQLRQPSPQPQPGIIKLAP